MPGASRIRKFEIVEIGEPAKALDIRQLESSTKLMA